MRKVLPLLLILSLLLSGCASPERTVSAPAPTLPEPASPYAAPTALEDMPVTAQVPLYLPSRDGQRLIVRYEEMTLRRGQDSTRQIVQALLNARPDGTTLALGGTVSLQLYGRWPVVTDGQVCTVDLAASALELEPDALYTAALALAATLEAACGIRYVNLLVASQPVGYDLAGNLPAGAVSARPGEELPLLWEQMEARMTPLGASAAAMPLTAAAALYFPLAQEAGLTCEVRSLSFPGQSPEILAAGLLDALSAGARSAEGACAMPDLSAMLAEPPAVSQLAEGGRMLTISFNSTLSDRLALAQIDTASFYASLTQTMTTFIPQLTAVRLMEGGTLIGGVQAADLNRLVFDSGMQRRRQFADYWKGWATVYLARNGRLCPVRRAVPAGAERSPAALMELLIAGPTAAERREGITGVLPAGLDSTDLLGLTVTDGVLLVNLSPRFASLTSQNLVDEQLLCYSLVTTLCEALQVREVRFFFYGDTRASLGGQIFWQGSFLLNRALVE